MAHRPDGGNVIAELSNGTLTAKYLRGMNLISRTDSSRTTYYLFNAHGDVVDLANSSGSSVKSYDYDAFGNEKSPSASDRNPFRYCGEYWDTETGTYYLRARYYDPLIGRFTQPDSHWTSANAIYGDNPNQLAQREDALGLTSYTYSPQISCILQSGNLYVYCINDPINGSDPEGEYLHILAGALIGGAANAIASIVTNEMEGKKFNLETTAVAFATGAVSGGLSAGGLAVLGVQNTRLVQAGIDAALSAVESVVSDYLYDKREGTSTSLGDYVAHAVVSAGTAFAFSYVGGGSDGSDMNKLYKEAKSTTAKAKQAAAKYGKEAKPTKAAKKYLGKIWPGAKRTLRETAVSTASNATVSNLYKHTYDKYAK